jgi:hypothetical protein
MKKHVLVQIAKRAEPAEGDGEENNAGDISEQQVSQPAAARSFTGKPNCTDKRSERDPTKPGLIERRKAQ